MSALLIPLAVDASTGRIVHAHEGERGRTFRCPNCKAVVVWRQCDNVKRRSHFAHAPDEGCGESAIHAAAKMLVAQHIGDWLAGKRRCPVVTGPCRKCDGRTEPSALDIPTGASVDVEIELASGLKPDVCVGNLALEIVYRHPVSAEKAERFAHDGIEWIELDAEPLLDDPPRWRMLRTSRVLDVCLSCVRLLQDAARRAEEDASRAAAASRGAGLDLVIRKRDLEALGRRIDTEATRVAQSVADAERRILSADSQVILAIDVVNRRIEAEERKVAVATQRAADAAKIADARIEAAMVDADRRAIRKVKEADQAEKRLGDLRVEVAKAGAERDAIRASIGAARKKYEQILSIDKASTGAVDGLGRPLEMGQHVYIYTDMKGGFMMIGEGTIWAVSDGGWAHWVGRSVYDAPGEKPGYHVARLGAVVGDPAWLEASLRGAA